MNLFQWGDKLIAVISAVVTVFVSGLIAVIKFKTVVLNNVLLAQLSCWFVVENRSVLNLLCHDIYLP